jgi:hypothetical protein
MQQPLLPRAQRLERLDDGWFGLLLLTLLVFFLFSLFLLLLDVGAAPNPSIGLAQEMIHYSTICSVFEKYKYMPKDQLDMLSIDIDSMDLW